jgi:hypothetical protein
MAAAALQQALDNYDRILVLVTQAQAAGSTQASVDAVVAAATGAGVLAPKPTYTVDGETWNWMEYQDFILRSRLALEQSLQRAQGPYLIRSRGGF